MNDALSHLSTVIGIALAYLILFILIKVGSFLKMYGIPRFTIDRWHRQFEDLQTSSDIFYEKIENILEEKSYPDVAVSRITLAQMGLLSSRREYLRITRDQYIFDICAAPFGRDFYVSWWLAMNISFIEQVLLSIPLISSAYTKYLMEKTYYQMDTENMFRESIQTIVANIIAEMTELGPERQQLSDISVAAEEIA